MPDLEKYQNELVDPVTRQPVQIDQRLLNEQLWRDHPALVNRLLKWTATQGASEDRGKLAEVYLTINEMPSCPTAPTETECDYFLVLGNVLNDDASPRPELISRLKRTLFMSRAHPTSRLLVSGGAQVQDVKEAAVMKKWLTDRGVSAERIVVESQSLDTVENIRMSADLLTGQNAKRVGLISGSNGAGRAACLLPTHLKHIGSTIQTANVAPAFSDASDASDACDASDASDATARTHDELARERFLLFKDLGRILGIWKYRSWARPLSGG